MQQIVTGQYAFDFPSSLEDITLGQYLDKKDLYLERDELEQRIRDVEMFKEFGYGEDGEEYTEEQYAVDYAKANQEYFVNLLKILKIFVPEEQHPQLTSIPYYKYLDLVHKLDTIELSEVDISSNVEGADILFICKEAAQYDIDRLKNELKDLSWLSDFKKKLQIFHKIKTFKSGRFIVEPVSRQAFQQKIFTDSVERELPTVPASIQKDRDELVSEGKNGTLEEVYSKYIQEDASTLDELMQKNRKIAALGRFFRLYKEGQNQVGLKIISHIAVPYGEEYNYEYSEQRSEGFKHMKMSEFKKIMDFFFTLKRLWKSSLELSSNLQKRNQQKNLQSSARRGDG